MSYGSQSIASVFVGTPLALGLCGLYAQFGPADPATDFLVAVFLLLPVWSAVMVWGLKRRHARTAWAGLGGAGVLVAAAVLIARRSLEG